MKFDSSLLYFLHNLPGNENYVHSATFWSKTKFQIVCKWFCLSEPSAFLFLRVAIAFLISSVVMAIFPSELGNISGIESKPPLGTSV